MGCMEQWIFGYGSLIWRVDFPYRERRRASIDGWVRRFWQGSHDHRGTPEAPDRVLTLIEAPGQRCAGMAYRIDAAVFAHLDHREKNGYRRIDLPIRLDGAQGAEIVQGTAYIGDASNFAFLGPAPLAEIAAQIARSHGPSGSNADYVLELAAALAELGADDAHVQALAARVAALQSQSGRSPMEEMTRPTSP